MGTPGQDGDCLLHGHSAPSKKSAVTMTANTLFCFVFYTADTGSTKPSFELDLVRTQLFLGAGIFGCEDWKVYSDVETWISPAPKLQNCKYVNYGFFGSLAVVSHDAAATYMANLDDCKSALNYMGHEKVTGNQAWGEDLFQQR